MAHTEMDTRCNMWEMIPATKRTFTPPTPGELIAALHSKTTYAIGDLIGEGHFSLVYACKDDWNNDLAAKVLKPLGSHEEVGKSGLEEIQKLLLVRHPHITYLYDAFEYKDTFYLITERCHQSLHDLFKQGTATQFQFLPVARCLLQAVDFIHRMGFVHQDIHPGNVFMTFARDGQGKKTFFAPSSFKLGDLGVAKLIGEAAVARTRGWMAPPELIPGNNFGPVDHRIDIYHVGLLLLQVALAKELQFSLEHIAEGKPREMALTLQPPLKAALEKALRRHVLQRTQSAKELWNDLNSGQR
jgi:serine/threonine protein kinase